MAAACDLIAKFVNIFINVKKNKNFFSLFSQLVLLTQINHAWKKSSKFIRHLSSAWATPVPNGSAALQRWSLSFCCVKLYLIHGKSP